MKAATQPIPQSLIYEMVDHQPIYYNGYKAYLSGNKELEELMGSSYLQSLIITKLVFWLMSCLSKDYVVLTNEVGLQIKDGNWRAADIAIVEQKKLINQKKKNKYLTIPPKVVVEIDTKAAIEQVNDSFGYFHKKTDELLNFGVEKVIWIFTDSQKVMIAEPNKSWEILDWSNPIEVLEGCTTTIKNWIETEP